MSNPVCCFCGKHCENQYGNNPYPANKEPEARCCNECNASVVIPARLAMGRLQEYVDKLADAVADEAKEKEGE